MAPAVARRHPGKVAVTDDRDLWGVLDLPQSGLTAEAFKAGVHMVRQLGRKVARLLQFRPLLEGEEEDGSDEESEGPRVEL